MVAEIIIGRKFGTVDGLVCVEWTRVTHTRPRLRLPDVSLPGTSSLA